MLEQQSMKPMMFQLNPNTKEYADVSKNIQKSLGKAIIESIVRVQNKGLWESYLYSKAQLSDKHDEDIDQIKEDVLFFSTEKVKLAQVCESDNGLDLSLK